MGKFFRGRGFSVNQLNVSGVLDFMLKFLYGMSAKVLTPECSVSVNTNWGQCTRFYFSSLEKEFMRGFPNKFSLTWQIFRSKNI